MSASSRKRRSGGARGGEFALIDAFLRPFGLSRDGRPGPASSGVATGPGDDCAALRPRKGRVLLASTDALVEGVHFDLALSSARDAGHKALAVNLSDLAAAGGTPRWLLCALGVPRSLPGGPAALRRTARQLGAGMAALALRAGIALVGGNVASGERWSLTLTVLGEAAAPLSRRGARPGDRLVLCGALGEAALGLGLLRERSGGPLSRALRDNPAGLRAAVRAQVRPVPLLAAGREGARLASAAIDVSDGLLADLGHLLRSSGCAARLDLGRLPRSAAVRAAERALAEGGAHPFALSLAGGEDYALLLAVRPARELRLLAALHRAGAKTATVGECTRGAGVSLFLGGRPVAPPPQGGWDHLRTH